MGGGADEPVGGGGGGGKLSESFIFSPAAHSMQDILFK